MLLYQDPWKSHHDTLQPPPLPASLTETRRLEVDTQELDLLSVTHLERWLLIEEQTQLDRHQQPLR